MCKSGTKVTLWKRINIDEVILNKIDGQKKRKRSHNNHQPITFVDNYDRVMAEMEAEKQKPKSVIQFSAPLESMSANKGWENWGGKFTRSYFSPVSTYNDEISKKGEKTGRKIRVQNDRGNVKGSRRNVKISKIIKARKRFQQQNEYNSIAIAA